MSVSDPFDQLLELQRDLYEKAYAEALSLDLLGLGILGKYAEEYERSLPDSFDSTDMRTVVAAIEASPFTLYGDFHTLKQSQRGLLRILRQLRNPSKCLLAMEMFSACDQPHIDAFMKDEISEIQFMETVRYKQRWGFPWRHYLPILLWAKDHGVQLVGANCDGSVYERDTRIAERLMGLKEDYPEFFIVLMIGEHHLADQHLPLELAKKGLCSSELCRIFGNVEKYYFSSKRPTVLSTEYIDLKKNRFCVLNSPPWIKWQSVTIFHEESEGPPDDDSRYEDEIEDESSDDRFHATLHALTSFLKMEPPPTLNDFYLYRSSPGDFFQHLLNMYPVATASALMSVAETEGVLFPLYGTGVFLGEFTQNNLIQAAGEYLRGISRSGPICHTPKDLFLQVLLNACAGRVASKIFNPRRKGTTIADIQQLTLHSRRKRLISSAKQQRSLMKRLLGLHFDLLNGHHPTPKNRLWQDDANANFVVARALGDILGQEIYQKVIRGQCPTRLLTDLFVSSADPLTFLLRAYHQIAIGSQQKSA